MGSEEGWGRAQQQEGRQRECVPTPCLSLLIAARAGYASLNA